LLDVFKFLNILTFQGEWIMVSLKRRQLLSSAGILAASLSLPVSAYAVCTKLPEKWDEAYDVVIVGSGFAGTSAAAEALSKKASVVVLEKMPVIGGNSAIAGGGFACWTDSRKLREKYNLGEDSLERHRNDTIKGGDYYNLPELVDVVVSGAPAAMDWMLDEGDLELNKGIGRVGGHTAYRDHMATGERYLRALTTIAKKNGFTGVKTLHRVTRLWQDDKTGRIVGVEVHVGPKGDKVINIKANKGVVLAAGGFGRDVKFRMQHVPTLTAAYNSTNQPSATADTLKMAQDIGADTLHLAFIQLFPTADAKTGAIDRPALFPIQFPGFGAIYVSNKGKRFVSELQRRDVVSQAELATGDKNTWCVFNPQVYAKLTDKAEMDKFVATGRLKTGNTIAELAKAMGVDAVNLEATIKEHNDILKAKKDPKFGKPITDAMQPMTEGPYYAVSQWPSVHHCQGGVRINPKAQVINVHGNVIPGLYAAGEFVGGVHGNNRLGGNAIADCIVFGRVAGRNAAAN
jgi:fumarate reductase flavoprotein subunit